MAAANPVVRLDAAGGSWLRKSTLEEQEINNNVSLIQLNRRYYGRELTPATIEAVIRAAEFGHMRDMTDLIYETVAIDPHLSSTIGKRFRALVAMAPKVVPATGDGIDPRKAQVYADVVRQQLTNLTGIRKSITQLNWGHCHGRAALEKVWKENPGGPVQWSIDRLEWVHPRRLSFGLRRELRLRDDPFHGWGFESRGLDLAATPEKFITFTPQLFNDYPEREGFGPRALYWSFFKRFSQRERLVLLEVFGKPWRIVSVQKDANVSPESLDSAVDAIDAMGANATGRVGQGIQVDTQQPGAAAGQIHREVINDANDEISKLVLGQPRTTDAKPGAGMNSSADEVAQDEQGSVIAADGWNISEVLTDQLAKDIIRLNFGDSEVVYAPAIQIAYELPPDRTQEIDRTSKAYSIGVPLKVDEVYERIGFTKPGAGDEVVKQQPPPTMPIPGAGGAPGGFDGTPEGKPGEQPKAQPKGEGGAAGEAEDPLAVARAVHVLALISRLLRSTPNS